jgi:hypothetical protein
MHMKKLLLIIGFFISVSSFAQDTTWVEQYCRLEATGRLFSNKVTIDVDFGESRRVFGDYRIRDEESGKLKKFNSVTDALNYLGSQGWILVNAFPIGTTSTNSNSNTYHYYFKKLFRKSDAN